MSPHSPLKPCAEAGCGALVTSGRCNQHRKQHDKRDRQWRGSANDRGYNYRWSLASKRHLAHSPFCVMCLAKSIVTPATLTDHIIPVQSANDPLFWDESNWQSLDVDCHAAKTAEDKAKGLTR